MNLNKNLGVVAAVAAGCLATAACAPARQAAAAQVGSADYERAACAEVPDADRDEGPFARRERIVGVEELREKTYPKAPPQPVGVAVYVRAAPGVTEQWVGRVIECHLAHRAVVGDRIADRDSPLFAEDAKIRVSSTPTAFRVAITSLDLDVARSVIEKGNRLVAQ
jgi:hypothetical protein